VFAILIANGQLITLVRLKKCFLHPVDLHMIFNLVTASDSFKHAESWTPVCLPKFDSRSVRLVAIITRGQSNLTKSASWGAHSPVRGYPRGSKVVPLNSWGRVSY